MFKKYSYILLFFLPFLLKLVVVFFFAKHVLIVSSDIIEDIIFSGLIFTLISNISKPKRILKWSLLGIYILYFIIEINAFLINESNFSASYMFALLDSNRSELVDFFDTYIKPSSLIVVLLLVFNYLFLIRENFSTSIKLSNLQKCFIALVCVAALKLSGSIENNAYYNMVRGTYGYYKLNSLANSTASIDAKKVFVKSDNDVLVVILGESVAKGHMQLYGYPRATTPLLDNLKDSLMVYKKVIAPDVLTTKVVPKLLTSLSNNLTVSNPDNILEILNLAKYDTYWISNQRPIGFHENVISQLVSVSNHVKFLSYKNHLENSNFDAVVLPVLKDALSKAGKKVIFVHLIGSHFNYGNRYPESFKVFKTPNGDEPQQIIDQYDNSILYNDFIVTSIINQVKSLNQKSAVLYLSDHGEDVYDESNFAGHTETNMTKSMIEIPFLLWASKSYDLPDDFVFDPERKFMTDDFYSALGHILGITYPSIDYSKSIFSTSFKEKETIFINGMDYNQMF